MTDEKVLCFRRSLFDDLGAFQGLSLAVDRYLPVITAPDNVVYIPRAEAELDRAYKQLIPYVLIACGNKILRYRRGKGGGENRLHGLYSVGVGGHISDQDTAGYREAMRRELKEEIGLDNFKDTIIGVLNDDSNGVGYVHLGIVHVVNVLDESILGTCNEISEPEFVPFLDACRDLDSYETWSKLCLSNVGHYFQRDTEQLACDQ